MPVPTSLGQLSQTASMNSPAGGENVFPDQDDYERQQFANDAILRDGAHQWLTGVSGTNTVTGSTAATSAVSAYSAGQVFRFVAAGANTGAVTLNVNGLGAKAVTKRGATALAAGDIAAGSVVTVTYDGTQFQVPDQADSVQISGNQTVAGVKTFTSPPVVPTATDSNQAVNKGQMDAADAATLASANSALAAAIAGTLTAADFTGSNASISFPFGFMRLPNGGILQWGRAWVPSDGSASVNFAIAFPTGCFGVIATPLHIGTLGGNDVISCHVISFTQTAVTLGNSDINATGNHDTYFLAWGA